MTPVYTLAGVILAASLWTGVGVALGFAAVIALALWWESNVRR